MANDVNSVGIMDDDELADPGGNSDAPDPLIDETPRSGALRAAGVGTPGDAQARVSAGRDSMGALQSQIAAHSQMAADGYAAQRKALQQATDRLTGMDFGPSPQEQAYHVAAAYGVGDGAGHLNIGAVNQANAENLGAQRQASLQREQMLQQMYQQMPQAQIGQANALLGRDIQQARIQQSENNSAQAQANKLTSPTQKALPNGMVLNPITGAMEYHPEAAQATLDLNQKKLQQASAAKVAMQRAQLGIMAPQDIDFWAHSVKQGGSLPAGLARGNPMLPSAVAARVAEIARAEGSSDPASNMLAEQAIRKAEALNLGNLTKQYGAFKGYENTMMGSLQLAVNSSNAVDRTNVPKLNSIFQSGQRHFTGNSPLAVFDLNNNTLVSEYAKIMSGSMGNTPVAEGIAKEAHSKLMTAMSKGTYADVAGAMVKEAQMRNQGLVQNINDSHQRLAQPSMINFNPPQEQPTRPGQGNSGGPPPGWKLHMDAKGNKAYVSPDGKQFQSVP